MAVQNEKFANREEELRARTNAAKQEVERFDRVIAATNGVDTEHKQELALLRQRYRTGQASESDYKKRLKSINDDIEALKTNIRANEKTIDAINRDLQRLGRAGTNGLVTNRDELLRQHKVFEMKMNELNEIRRIYPQVIDGGPIKEVLKSAIRECCDAPLTERMAPC